MVAMTRHELDRTATERDRAFAARRWRAASRAAAEILDPWTGDEVASKDAVEILC